MTACFAGCLAMRYCLLLLLMFVGFPGCDSQAPPPVSSEMTPLKRPADTPERVAQQPKPIEKQVVPAAAVDPAPAPRSPGLRIARALRDLEAGRGAAIEELQTELIPAWEKDRGTQYFGDISFEILDAARTLIEKGRQPLAVRLLEMLLVVSQKDELVSGRVRTILHSQLALEMARAGKRTRAVEIVKDMEEMKYSGCKRPPGKSETYYAIARVCIEQGELDEALAVIRLGRGMLSFRRPFGPTPMSELVGVYAEHDRLPKALKLVRSEFKKSDRDQALRSVVDGCLRAGRFAQARKLIPRIARGSSRITVLGRLAHFAKQKGDQALALQALQQAHAETRRIRDRDLLSWELCWLTRHALELNQKELAHKLGRQAMGRLKGAKCELKWVRGLAPLLAEAGDCRAVIRMLKRAGDFRFESFDDWQQSTLAACLQQKEKQVVAEFVTAAVPDLREELIGFIEKWSQEHSGVMDEAWRENLKKKRLAPQAPRGKRRAKGVYCSLGFAERRFP